ncbi:MAG: DUF3892 domain-containing protein [Deltaproteobacteria bacterium]|nr:DUF3892 domain-containing protein [Deltaproteobacteria bacterium]
MAEKVECIVKGDADQHSDCRCITSIRTDAQTYTRLEAHDRVKQSPGSIFVAQGGSKADLVAAEREGLKYVRTEPNDTTADNLLNAPTC